MWAEIADAYGNAFTNQFGSEPNQTWADGLAGYEVQDILVAVGRVINSGSEYAPNLAAVLAQLNEDKPPAQHLMSRTVGEALNAPVIDLSEKNLIGTDTPDIPMFDFKALWRDA